jgi:hypothetical protein
MSATKTLQFYGMGYSSEYNTHPTSAQVTVTLDGNTVYEGAVPTRDTLDWTKQFTDQVVLFTFEVPDTLTTGAMTITCTAGYSVDFSAVKRNLTYDRTTNTPTGFARANVNTDARENITLDGTPQQKGPDGDLFPAKAEWTYTIPRDAALAFDLVIDQPVWDWTTATP